MVIKIVMLSVLTLLYAIYFYGAILFLPSIARSENKATGKTTPCHAIHGAQFLIVTVVFGACHVMGSVCWYPLSALIRSNVIISTSTFAVTATYIVMCLNSQNFTLMYICIGIVQILSMILNQELLILLTNKTFFSPKYLAIAIGASGTFFNFGSLVGNTISQLLPYNETLYAQMGIAIACFITTLSLCIK